jgi:hypothetical protein
MLFPHMKGCESKLTHILSNYFQRLPTIYFWNLQIEFVRLEPLKPWHWFFVSCFYVFSVSCFLCNGKRGLTMAPPTLHSIHPWHDLDFLKPNTFEKDTVKTLVATTLFRFQSIVINFKLHFYATITSYVLVS